MSLQNQQDLFDIPEGVHYFNIASLSPSFKSITDVGIKAIREKSTPYVIPSSDFFDPVTELKKLFVELVHANEYNRIATIPSVSYGMATVANNITLKSSDEILIIDEQFPSNYYIWKKLADTYNAKLSVIKQPKGSNSVQQWNQDILNNINENTALVAMGNVHWSNGVLFDLKTIRKKTKEFDSLLVIDGSQSVGALPFSVEEIQPDALVCAGYKWMFGPYGCGYAYYGSYFDQGTPIEENWANRLHSENLAGLTEYQSQYKPLANRYGVGESGSFIYVKMQIAALKQIIEWTPNAIQEYCKNISKEAVRQLKELGCLIENDENRTHHMFGIKLPKNTDVTLLKEKFKEENVFVSFRGNYVRVSCHLYTTEKDFDILVQCIQSIL
ncbi:MAG: aminotransferase class V-fold PLP-dependent enzyme [Flavobacteriaceae bacterium]|nr:aminotransferase class V-fold PLP-dependent enzyme [Flavobacteriaceae bacterium]